MSRRRQPCAICFASGRHVAGRLLDALAETSALVDDSVEQARALYGNARAIHGRVQKVRSCAHLADRLVELGREQEPVSNARLLVEIADHLWGDKDKAR